MSKTETTLTQYTYDEVRKHAYATDAWMAIHGKVYDVTSFVKSHPGGAIIHCGYGRDATILFETHHNCCDITKINPVMKKYLIGEIKDYTDLCTYKSPFATAMLSRVREAIKGESLRESTYSVTACYLTNDVTSYVSGHYIFAILGGFTMGLGHLAGHAGNHWAVSESDNFNRAISVLCTSLWGLREKNWEFSHLISHHCYNYTDRDYIMEQHAPFAYFRIRECDRWRPIHAWQHLIYLTTPFTAFFLGAIAPR